MRARRRPQPPSRPSADARSGALTPTRLATPAPRSAIPHAESGREARPVGPIRRAAPDGTERSDVSSGSVSAQADASMPFWAGCDGEPAVVTGALLRTNGGRRSLHPDDPSGSRPPPSRPPVSGWPVGPSAAVRASTAQRARRATVVSRRRVRVGGGRRRPHQSLVARRPRGLLSALPADDRRRVRPRDADGVRTLRGSLYRVAEGDATVSSHRRIGESGGGGGQLCASS